MARMYKRIVKYVPVRTRSRKSRGRKSWKGKW